MCSGAENWEVDNLAKMLVSVSSNEMVDIIVRGLDTQTVTKLQNRATYHGQSLEDEAKEILQQASPVPDEGLVPLRENRKNLPEIAMRLRAMRLQIGWKDVPIRSLIDEGRRF